MDIDKKTMGTSTQEIESELKALRLKISMLEYVLKRRKEIRWRILLAQQSTNVYPWPVGHSVDAQARMVQHSGEIF